MTVSDDVDPDDFHLAEQAFVQGDLAHAIDCGDADCTRSFMDHSIGRPRAAVVALTMAVRAGDADEAEALRWMSALHERRPSEGAWSLHQPLLESMLRLPSLDRETRRRLREERRRLALGEDATNETPSPNKPFWKRWFE